VVDRLVLVNGLPGSGKTTLAAALAAELAAPLVAKDAIKEAVADAVPAAPSRALGATVMQAAWSLVAAIGGTVVFEAWWYRPRDLSFAEDGLAFCGHPPVVEVWCDVDPELARHRYATRRRHRIHADVARLAESPRLWSASTDATPLGLGPVIRVPTEGAVDVAAVARAVTAALGPPDGRPSTRDTS
jgi:predicted kinase